jgi:hypothetical protein
MYTSTFTYMASVHGVHVVVQCNVYSRSRVDSYCKFTVTCLAALAPATGAQNLHYPLLN